MTTVYGNCAPQFERVYQAFIENFECRGEVGAAVAVYEKGQLVVDLWGGIADLETKRPWTADTITCMMSVGKALPALAILMLVDRGQVELDKAVAYYWPEFAQSGKERITVKQLIGGLGALVFADAAPAGSAFDTEAMVKALELQAPEWQPGTLGAYHSLTSGILNSELLRRVDGRSVDVFIRDEITDPLHIDFQYGVDDQDLDRVAPIIPNPESRTLQGIADPNSKLGRAWRVLPLCDDFFNNELFRKAVFPSANGHGNARALARLYGSLACREGLDGVRLLSPGMVDQLRMVQWHNYCDMTGETIKYGLGFFINNPPSLSFGPNLQAFGHPGAGGAVAIADPENELAFSYSPNFMCAEAGLGARYEALIRAVY